MGRNCCIEFLTDGKHLSAVDKTPYSLIFSVSLHGTAQYRHIAVCTGLYAGRAKSLHVRYSLGCIESSIQPSPMEKSSRTTLHYVIQTDSARDLVLHIIREIPILQYGDYMYYHQRSSQKET